MGQRLAVHCTSLLHMHVMLTINITLNFSSFTLQVWNLKTCSVCMKDERNKSQLFVHHMTPIVKHLQSKQVTPIMWDDMMRRWPVEYLKGMVCGGGQGGASPGEKGAGGVREAGSRFPKVMGNGINRRKSRNIVQYFAIKKAQRGRSQQKIEGTGIKGYGKREV